MIRDALLACAVLAFSIGPAAALQSGKPADLTDLSLEQLSEIIVSTVSGRAEPLARALGSVYVISSEDIRRSGATTIPEILRLAPNLQVARTGASGYAITARGFNGVLANKLLVLIDGRSVYTPTFSGVFWDALDVLIEDIERVEVISGPGGVLWGANAVNGVINILTRSSADTRGGLIAGGAGDEEARLVTRFGGAGGHYRVYAQASRSDDSVQPDGTENSDGSDRIQAGFRSDWGNDANRYTVQGDLYAEDDNLDPEPRELRGVNVLGRYHHEFGEGSDLRVQGYFERTTREQQELDTYDLELAHALPAHGAHTLLWGGGFRQARDHITNSAALAILPENKTLTSWNVYGQDVIALGQDVNATVGLRVDDNAYTGTELLPSVRIGWRPSPDDLFWAAWSRAVRTPARFDRELFLPGLPPFLLIGGPDFEPEISNVYEIGYRGQPTPRLSWAATAFYHRHDDQRSIAPTPAGAVVANDREGHTRGVETWGALRLTDFWRIWLGYTYLDRELRVRPGAVDLQPETSIGSDPKQWAKLRMAFDLGPAVELDLLVRYYDELENIDVPAYTAVDVHLGWIVSQHVELALLLQNTTDAEHVEWSPGAEFDRAAFVSTVIRF